MGACLLVAGTAAQPSDVASNTAANAVRIIGIPGLEMAMLREIPGSVIRTENDRNDMPERGFWLCFGSALALALAFAFALAFVLYAVIPAKAGIAVAVAPKSKAEAKARAIPAFAGMTS